MDTQLKYIKIALLISLALLVLIICVVARKLSTMECAEITPMQMNSVSQEQDTPPQNQVAPASTDGTMPVVQEGTSTPPPPPLPEGVPSLEEMEARWAEHEAETVNIPKTYPVQTDGVMTPEEALKKFGGEQNTPQ